MEHKDRIEEIEVGRTEAKEAVARSNALLRLCQNDDFNLIIEKTYFEKEPVRLVHLKAHPSQSAPEAQQAILNALTGIGELRQFFMAVRSEGMQMEKALAAASEEIEYLNDELAGE